MAEGKRMTLAELTKREEERRKRELAEHDAWLATPEGQAWKAEQDAFHKRMSEADERAWQEQLKDPYTLGHADGEAGNPDSPPDDLDDAGMVEYYRGYDDGERGTAEDEDDG